MAFSSKWVRMQKKTTRLTELSYPKRDSVVTRRRRVLVHMLSYVAKITSYHETKRDAAMLAIHHSKNSKMKSSRVNLVRVEQVWKDPRIKNHGRVYLTVRLLS